MISFNSKIIIYLIGLLLSVVTATIDDWVMQNAKFQTPLSSLPVLPGRYLVELAPSTAPLAYFSQIHKQLFDQSGIDLAVHHTYDNPSIFYGASIGFETDDVMMMSAQQLIEDFFSQDSIEKIYPVHVIDRPTLMRKSFANITQQLPPDLGSLGFPFNLVTQQLALARQNGYFGQDVLVGIVDSGVDYTHPALGGGFGPEFKVQVGYDFVGNHFSIKDKSSRQERPTPLDDCAASHLDDSGHGTHVSGIIAADDRRYNFTGVAPRAKLGMWRVFSCNGSTTSDLVIKGLISAFEAGCDIINLSLGGPNNWAEDVSALVANRIANQGVVVVVAAGNDGAHGAFYISSPSTGTKVISVGSINNNVTLGMTMQANNQSYAYELSSSTSVFPNGTLVSYADPKSLNEDQACAGFTPSRSISGKIVLVQRGNCTYNEKAQTVAKLGAIGLVIYDPAHPAMPFSPMTDEATIPVAGISGFAGAQLAEFPQGIPVEFGTSLLPQPVSTGGLVSEFSSVGPTYEIGLKPNLAGIGGYVFSTLPLAAGGYGILSGTSMASPFVAGCVALYLQGDKKHGERVDTVKVMEKFMNYAHPVQADSMEEDGLLDHPVKQGAGLVQVYDTIQGPLLVSPSFLSFNDTVHRQSQNITITNNGNQEQNVSVVDQEPSISLIPYDTSLQGYAPLEPVRYGKVKARLSLSSAGDHHWTLAPGESAEIQVTVTSIDYGDDDGDDDPLTMFATSDNQTNLPFPIFGGFLQIKASDVIRVPYFGIQGNVQDLAIFDKEYPRLTPDAIVVRFLTGTAMFVSEVWKADSKGGKSKHFVGYAAVHTFLPRNTLKTHTQTVFPWSRTILVHPPPIQADNHSVRHLPSGSYVMVWKALKLLADPALPSSWESVTSEPFEI